MTNLFFSDWRFIVFNCCLYKRIIAGLWSRDNERNWENLNSFKREKQLYQILIVAHVKMKKYHCESGQKLF